MNGIKAHTFSQRPAGLTAFGDCLPLASRTS